MTHAHQHGADEGRWLIPHAEIHRSSSDDSPIFVYCDCVIGTTHGYDDWLELPENAQTLKRARRYRSIAGAGLLERA